jgi:hypothetical protein
MDPFGLSSDSSDVALGLFEEEEEEEEEEERLARDMFQGDGNDPLEMNFEFGSLIEETNEESMHRTPTKRIHSQVVRQLVQFLFRFLKSRDFERAIQILQLLMPLYSVLSNIIWKVRLCLRHWISSYLIS